MHQRKDSKFSVDQFKLSCFRPRTRIILAVLSVELLLLLYNRSLSRSLSAISNSIITDSNNQCSSGMVYVYELPTRFNVDLIKNCSKLNPWQSLCNPLSNGGFGVKDKTSLKGIVPDEFLSSWYTTDQFSVELIFHERVAAHRCRTLDPAAATAFYIPFYSGLAVGKHLWSLTSSSEDRDRDCADMLSWLKQQEPWKMTDNGRGHFITLGRITWDFRRPSAEGWGSSFLRMPEMKSVTRLIVERSPWDARDIGVPYPTAFHPRTATEIRRWQQFVRLRNRTTLFSFAGSARPGFDNDFRGILLNECADSPTKCRRVNCSSATEKPCGSEAVGLFLNSVFCLQPRGDSYTRRSLFDCMIAGAIPVVFWKRSLYEQYGLYLNENEGEEQGWSVFIDNRKVKRGKVKVSGLLEKIGSEEKVIERMRDGVIEMIPRLVYAGRKDGFGDGVEDAFDVAFNGVLRRINGVGRRAVW